MHVQGYFLESKQHVVGTFGSTIFLFICPPLPLLKFCGWVTNGTKISKKMIIFFDKTHFFSQIVEKHPKTYGPTASAKLQHFSKNDSTLQQMVKQKQILDLLPLSIFHIVRPRKTCVGFSILDCILFLLKFIFLFNKKLGLNDFKIH